MKKRVASEKEMQKYELRIHSVEAQEFRNTCNTGIPTYPTYFRLLFYFLSIPKILCESLFYSIVDMTDGVKTSLNELLLDSVNRVTVERVINLALSKSFTRNGTIAIELLKTQWLQNIADLKGCKIADSREEQRVAPIPRRLAERVLPLAHVFGCTGRPRVFMAKPKEHNHSFRGQVFALRKVLIAGFLYIHYVDCAFFFCVVLRQLLTLEMTQTSTKGLRGKPE